MTLMAPSSVLRRINDQLVAPRASRGELLVAYATALSGVVLATALAADAGLSALPLVAGAAVVLAAPLELRRPVAFAAMGSGELRRLTDRLLPPGLLAEMLTASAVPPGALPIPLYDRDGLGLAVIDTPSGLIRITRRG